MLSAGRNSPPVFPRIHLLKLFKDDVGQTLEDLHAILDIPKEETHTLRLHHPSFRDFVLDKGQCGDTNFLVGEKQTHQKLADNYIRLLSTSLKQGICEVDAPGVFVD